VIIMEKLYIVFVMFKINTICSFIIFNGIIGECVIEPGTWCRIIG
jgi:hypothetical protein